MAIFLLAIAVILLISVMYVNENKAVLVGSIFLIGIAAVLTVLVVIKNVLTIPVFINLEERIIMNLNILLD